MEQDRRGVQVLLPPIPAAYESLLWARVSGARNTLMAPAFFSDAERRFIVAADLIEILSGTLSDLESRFLPPEVPLLQLAPPFHPKALSRLGRGGGKKGPLSRHPRPPPVYRQ